VDELERWLTSVGLDQLAPLLRANDIDHELLPELTEADLEKIGISLGHRKKLLKAAAHLKPAIAPSSPPASSPGATAASAERRHLTVMFYDLVNSTILATRHDPEDVREVLGAFHRRVGEAVARFTGFWSLVSSAMPHTAH
jgi:class 3 adenylate cyclase